MTAPATNNNKPREYIIGSMPHLAVIFKDRDGVAVEPSTVRFKVKKPDGSLLTYTYGSGQEIQKNTQTKAYSVDLSVDQAGDWFYRWESSGSHQTAAERRIIVLPTQVE